MSDKPDGGPVFPCGVPQPERYPGAHTVFVPSTGISLRDWFAGQALAGLAVQVPIGDAAMNDVTCAAALAYELADNMLVARSAE